VPPPLVKRMLSVQLQLKLFDLDAQQLIQSDEHALAVIQVGENEADVMNEACTLGILPALSENLPSDMYQ